MDKKSNLTNKHGKIKDSYSKDTFQLKEIKFLMPKCTVHKPAIILKNRTE